MSGHISEETLALYVGGDIASNRRGAIDAHLEVCDECRTSLSEFRHSQALFSGTFRDPAWNDLVELRQRIAGRVAGQQPYRRQWPVYAAAAATVALCFLFSIYKRPAVTYRAPTITAGLTPPAQSEPKMVARAPQLHLHLAQVKYRRPAPGIRSVALITRADQPPVIRIATSDPNVIIMWQSDEGTQRK